MTDQLHQTAKEITDHPSVQRWSRWTKGNMDRIYLTLVGHRDNFRGCNSNKIWIDNRTGDLHHQSGNGTTSDEWDESLDALLADHPAI